MKSSETKISENTSKAAAHQPFGEHCISLFSPNNKFTIEPKLTITQPNDVYEKGPDIAIINRKFIDIQTHPLPISSSFQLDSVKCKKEEERMQNKDISAEDAIGSNDFEYYEKRLSTHKLTVITPQKNIDYENRMLQRFEGPEHEDFGDAGLIELDQFIKTKEGKEWAGKTGHNGAQLASSIENDPFFKKEKKIKTDNYELTPGEVIALMGDFYKSWQDLKRAPKEEIIKLLGEMDKERAHTVSFGQATIDYEKITKGRYTALAEENKTHFSPYSRAEWSRLHKEAISMVSKDATEDKINTALLIDAAAAHFLTDAFAAGHLMDTQKVLAEIAVYLSRHVLQAENPQMQAYVAITSGKQDRLLLKIIHDHFNSEGFEVTNNKGMTWKTYGDDHVKNSIETSRIASLAVFLSRQQMYKAKSGEGVDENEVLDLLPDEQANEKVTQAAINFIPSAATQIDSFIYSKRDASELAVGKYLAPFVKANLDAIGDPSREAQILQSIEASKRNNTGPVVLPSFTVARF